MGFHGLSWKSRVGKHLSACFWSQGKRVLRLLERMGLQVVPLNYYSPIPSVAEIENGWEAKVPYPFLEEGLYDNEAMVAFLREALLPYAEEFNPQRDGDPANCQSFYWNNPSFGYSDAMALYCFVRHFKPKRILEIGGGFSTLVIEEALAKNGCGELWEIEPFPKPTLQRISSIKRFYQKPVQEVPLSVFEELEENDILFIDSTHTVKASSDCTFIYLKALPRVRKGVIIHSHDTFLPESLPKSWNVELHLYWTEHYLVQALMLSGNFKILFGSNYHRIFNKELLERFMGGKALAGGGSFWYTKR